MTYSLDFRKKVLAIKEKEDLSYATVSKRFGIGINTAFRWSTKLVPQKQRNRPATKIDMQALEKDIETYSEAYHHERAERLGVSKSGIWHALKRLKVTYKKNPKAPQGGPRKTLYFLPDSPKVPRRRSSCDLHR